MSAGTGTPFISSEQANKEARLRAFGLEATRVLSLVNDFQVERHCKCKR